MGMVINADFFICQECFLWQILTAIYCEHFFHFYYLGYIIVFRQICNMEGKYCVQHELLFGIYLPIENVRYLTVLNLNFFHQIIASL